jgi:nickel-dependent lactate racemase
MPIAIPYGHQKLILKDIDAAQHVQVLEPRRTSLDPVRLALAAPIGSPRLRELVMPGQKIAIVTSDISRPCPTDRMLPSVMEELGAAGVLDRDVLVVFGLGTHRPHTQHEREVLAGPDMAARLRLVDSDPADTVRVGVTSRGTPIDIFRPVVESDIRVVLGNVEPHYFAGFSGGLKAIVPGVCSVETIRFNHAWMVDPHAWAGALENNPVRQDLEEGASFLGVHFMLNVILDSDKNIVTAAAGHPIAAHRWACQVLDYMSVVEVDRKADIVVISAGGFPKDINLYQAHKALENAAQLIAQDGIIICVAECPEGFGNAIFEEWMVGSDPDSILERFKQGFVLGGHKAASVALLQKKAQIWLVSNLPDWLVRNIGMQPFHEVNEAFEKALSIMGDRATITVLPEGSAVVIRVIE